MLQKVGYERTIRYIEIAIAILALAALAGASWTLYDRLSQGSARLHEQRAFNYKIDHATDRLTCALEGIIKSQRAEINNPRSQTRRLYVSLGFRPEQIADIVDQANTAIDRELALLPAHPPCVKT